MKEYLKSNILIIYKCNLFVILSANSPHSIMVITDPW